MKRKSKDTGSDSKNEKGFFEKMFDREHDECVNSRKVKKATDDSNDDYELKLITSNKMAISKAERDIINANGKISFDDFVILVGSGIVLDSPIAMTACLQYLGKAILITIGSLVAFGFLSRILDAYL